MAITKAAVVTLAARWPRGERFDSLHGASAQLLQQHGFPVADDSRYQLSRELAILFDAGHLDLRLTEPEFSTWIPTHPRAHELALFEAQGRGSLTTPYRVPLPMTQETLAIVGSLDGSRSSSALARAFGNQVVDETLPLLARWGLPQP